MCYTLLYFTSFSSFQIQLVIYFYFAVVHNFSFFLFYLYIYFEKKKFAIDTKFINFNYYGGWCTFIPSVSLHCGSILHNFSLHCSVEQRLFRSRYGILLWISLANLKLVEIFIALTFEDFYCKNKHLSFYRCYINWCCNRGHARYGALETCRDTYTNLSLLIRIV